VPSDERKQVGPDPARPPKHDTGRGIIRRIIRGGTLQSSSLISTKSIPSSYGSLVIAPPLIVTGWKGNRKSRSSPPVTLPVVLQALAHVAECIGGRVVDGDHGDAPVAREIDGPGQCDHG